MRGLLYYLEWWSRSVSLNAHQDLTISSNLGCLLPCIGMTQHGIRMTQLRIQSGIHTNLYYHSLRKWCLV